MNISITANWTFDVVVIEVNVQLLRLNSELIWGDLFVA